MISDRVLCTVWRSQYKGTRASHLGTLPQISLGSPTTTAVPVLTAGHQAWEHRERHCLINIRRDWTGCKRESWTLTRTYCDRAYLGCLPESVTIKWSKVVETDIFNRRQKKHRVNHLLCSKLANRSVPQHDIAQCRVPVHHPWIHCSSHRLHTTTTMAKSKFEYVRQFENEDRLLPNCWIVVRVDGKAFHRFTDAHHFMKPNDERGLNLMTRAAQNVMEDFKDIVLAYGQSDEYSFIFNKASNMYNRRGSKIVTNVVSLFSSSFVMLWPRYFSTQELQYAPSFDGRVILYPTDQNLRDYLSWRQADCHINNLYNTCFWKLVQERGMSPAQAQERLKGTLSSDKNEILFSDFNINYNNLPELYRKGTILLRCQEEEPPQTTTVTRTGTTGRATTLVGNHIHTKARPSTVVLHTDLIGAKFWEDHPEILDAKK